jgi:GNAT superfamily N-acetyltransferase
VLGWSLEAAFDAAWPALRAVPTGDWLCKSAPGVSRRSNSANPAGSHARLTSRAVEVIEAVYTKWSQPAYVRLPSFVGDEADRLLDARGYEAEGLSLTLVGPLRAGRQGGAELLVLPSPEWREAVNRMNGRDGEAAETFDAVLALIDAPAAYAAVRRERRIVAAAYAVAFEGWLCLEAVVTDQVWRGRGLAAEAVSALMAWGATHGARAVGLQVQADNLAAQALYSRLGIGQELYRYHYRKAP